MGLRSRTWIAWRDSKWGIHAPCQYNTKPGTHCYKCGRYVDVTWAAFLRRLPKYLIGRSDVADLLSPKIPTKSAK